MPYMLVIGDKETASGRLAVRDRGSRDMREMSREDFITEAKQKIVERE